jgi:mono/diheme cytochrome c family protein
VKEEQMKRVAAIVVLLTVAIGPAVLAADGAAVYKAKCAMCHGSDGTGQTTMGKNLKLRDLGAAAVQGQTDAQLTAIVSDGKNKMPAYKTKLSAEEIKAVVAHVRTFKK